MDFLCYVLELEKELNTRNAHQALITKPSTLAFERCMKRIEANKTHGSSIQRIQNQLIEYSTRLTQNGPPYTSARKLLNMTKLTGMFGHPL